MAAFEPDLDPTAPARELVSPPNTPDGPEIAIPRWRSDDLLAGGTEARIAHGDTVYRLRVTMLGKLILTK